MDEKSCEFLMKHANLHPLGIHYVVECPPLVDLLGSWSAPTNEDMEAAEQKIKDFVQKQHKIDLHPNVPHAGGEEAGAEEEGDGVEQRPHHQR